MSDFHGKPTTTTTEHLGLTLHETSVRITDYFGKSVDSVTELLGHTTAEPFHRRVRPVHVWTDECEPFPELEPFIKWVQTYYVPVIIVFGIIGNLVSCAVFLTSNLKKRSSSYYLAALAVADIGSAFPFLLWWLDNVPRVKYPSRDIWCQAGWYLHYVFRSLSTWLIVAFTVERFIAVRYPLHRRRICTVARAKMTILCITVIAMVANSYSIYMIGSYKDDRGVYQCTAREEFNKIWCIVSIARILLTCIPFMCIVVLNVMIGGSLIRSGTLHNESIHSNRSSRVPSKSGLIGAEVLRRTASKMSYSSTSQQSMTKMLLIVSTVFVLLYMPFFIVLFLKYAWYLKWEKQFSTLTCLKNLLMILFCTNININFLLYAMCGSSFRQCLFQSIRNLLKRSPR